MNLCRNCNEEAEIFLCKSCYNKLINKENRFFDERKKYKKTESFLARDERTFFWILREKLDKDYIILPQINLQSLVKTDTERRNEELFRNLDFCIFKIIEGKDKFDKQLQPVLAIEINGPEHYLRQSTKKRDESVSTILKAAGLNIWSITNSEVRWLSKQPQTLYEKFYKIFGEIK